MSKQCNFELYQVRASNARRAAAAAAHFVDRERHLARARQYDDIVALSESHALSRQTVEDDVFRDILTQVNAYMRAPS